MIGRTILLLYFNLLTIENISAQNPIGLRAASYLRGIRFGTAVDVSGLRNHIDNNEYNYKIENNYI